MPWRASILTSMSLLSHSTEISGRSRTVPWRRSLRFKLVVAAIAVEVIMLSALLGNSFRLLDQAVGSQTETRLEALSPLLDAALAGRVFQRDHAEVKAIITRLTNKSRLTEITYIAVLDTAGAIIASTGHPDPTALPQEDHSVTEALTDLTYDVRLPLTIIDKKVGSVHFGLSLVSMVATQDQVVREGLIIAVIEILLSMLLLGSGGYLITRHILVLIEGTRRVAQGDYNTRISIPGKDEIAELAHDFNSMSAAIFTHVNDLRASEMRFQAIFNAVSEAIFIHDAATGKIVGANERMCEMFSCSLEEALGKDIGLFSSGIQPYTLDGALAKIQAAATGVPQQFEWHARTLDGKTFWVEVSLSIARIGEDYRLIAVVRDISERKQAAEALASEKERLAVTLRSIGDGVITTDTDGRIILLNLVAEKLTGWSQQEAQGRPLSEIFRIVNEQTRKPCENPAEKVIASGQIIQLANHTTLIAKDGTEYNIADSGAPIRNKESDVIGVVLVFRDVTEKNKMEEELIRAQKLESVGVLAGGIAHDFNNILAAILGNINLALFEADLQEGTKKLLSEAEKATIRAKDLTQQLLTFAKGGDPVKELSSLENVIKDSANFVLHGDKVACRFTFSEDLWLVHIDKGQISQVIQNMVLNASHAMPEGGVITITCENLSCSGKDILPFARGERCVLISIKDTGIGIPADVMDKIFDPYFTTKREGSGLGLAITQSIISKHNGHITVESALGVGSIFTIYLPASDKTSIPQQALTETKKISPKAKILIMDDDEMVRKVAQSMLAALGCEVVISSNGTEAVELYRDALRLNNAIDLVIMDLTIPGGMGGKDAVQEILKIDPDAKVVVSSGYSNDPIMANFKEYGFCGSIVKPYQLKELSKMISQVIG